MSFMVFFFCFYASYKTSLLWFILQVMLGMTSTTEVQNINLVHLQNLFAVMYIYRLPVCVSFSPPQLTTLTQTVCQSKSGSRVSPSAPWRCLGWPVAGRRHTQSAQGEICGRALRYSVPWWADRSCRTKCPAGSGSGGSREVVHPAPWNGHQQRASNNPGFKK